MKIGMKRLRDGSIACVEHERPGWHETAYLIQGTIAEGTRLIPTRWTSTGYYIAGDMENPYDIIEHLSDELHDPRTWRPAPEFKEGLWRHNDGSVDLYIGPVNYIESAWVHRDGELCVGSHYKWKDLCAGNNPPVEYVGPNPLRGPTG